VKHFYNARNVIPYIQDIKIINAFCEGVNDVKTVEEIAMKKPKMVADLLVVADVCIDASEARLDSLSLTARGPRRRDKTIRKSTRLITETAGIADIEVNNPPNRKRRGCSSVLLM
jgi:hypothetical protein